MTLTQARRPGRLHNAGTSPQGGAGNSTYGFLRAAVVGAVGTALALGPARLRRGRRRTTSSSTPSRARRNVARWPAAVSAHQSTFITLDLAAADDEQDAARRAGGPARARVHGRRRCRCPLGDVVLGFDEHMRLVAHARQRGPGAARRLPRRLPVPRRHRQRRLVVDGRLVGRATSRRARRPASRSCSSAPRTPTAARPACGGAATASPAAGRRTRSRLAMSAMIWADPSANPVLSLGRRAARARRQLPAPRQRRGRQGPRGRRAAGQPRGGRGAGGPRLLAPAPEGPAPAAAGRLRRRRVQRLGRLRRPARARPRSASPRRRRRQGRPRVGRAPLRRRARRRRRGRRRRHRGAAGGDPRGAARRRGRVRRRRAPRHGRSRRGPRARRRGRRRRRRARRRARLGLLGVRRAPRPGERELQARARGTGSVRRRPSDDRLYPDPTEFSDDAARAAPVRVPGLRRAARPGVLPGRATARRGTRRAESCDAAGDAATSQPAYIVGVDIGGTFTDCVVIGPDGSDPRPARCRRRPTIARASFFEAIEEAASRFGIVARRAARRRPSASCTARRPARTRSSPARARRSACVTTNGHGDAIAVMKGAGRLAGLDGDRLLDMPHTDKPEQLVARVARLRGDRAHRLRGRGDRRGSTRSRRRRRSRGSPTAAPRR